MALTALAVQQLCLGDGLAVPKALAAQTASAGRGLEAQRKDRTNFFYSLPIMCKARCSFVQHKLCACSVLASCEWLPEGCQRVTRVLRSRTPVTWERWSCVRGMSPLASRHGRAPSWGATALQREASAGSTRRRWLSMSLNLDSPSKIDLGEGVCCVGISWLILKRVWEEQSEPFWKAENAWKTHSPEPQDFILSYRNPGAVALPKG